MALRRVISASLSPNVERDDAWSAFITMLTPWSWQQGRAIAAVEAWFRQYCGAETAASFNSGRSALLAILRAFGVGAGDEVIVQAFTCVAVPNSVRWAGATPVFTDVDETLNLDTVDCARKITKRTKAIIVQHTFGVPAAMDAIVSLGRKHNLVIIDDCRHC